MSGSRTAPTEYRIHDDILILQSLLELFCTADDRDPEVLALPEQALVYVLATRLGEVDGGFVAEHVEVSRSDQAITSLPVFQLVL